jgi:hypothetical protein
MEQVKFLLYRCDADLKLAVRFASLLNFRFWNSEPEIMRDEISAVSYVV